MKTAVVLLALAAALVLQTTLSGMMVGGTVAVNLVLVAVVYLALAYGAVTGMLAGTIGGLTQDALAGGIVGIGGMTKTIVGFAVGVLGSQFNLSSTVPRLVMFVAATFVHEVMFEGLHAMIGGRPFALQWSATLIEALVNGLIGVIVFLLVERGPEAVQRRRMSRGTFGRKRF
ncbi:MAG TPA: rod shape-determining protein MreD [Vicinamibacterales bacterium]|nr:rod shape-determining protein MreD [Vicinamibacterales bacterium]